MKNYDEQRAFALLQKIGFTRVAGSPEEAKAAEILKAECESFGLAAAIEPFEIETGEVEASFEVLEPYRKSYTVRGYQCAENTPEEGLTADFLYVEDGLPVNLRRAKGKIVLVNGGLRIPLFRKLIEAGVAGIVTMDGSLRDKLDETDLHQRKLRAQVRRYGNLPAVQLRVADAKELVEMGASKAKITLKNENVKRTSHNVTATVPGTDFPEEVISFGAHYDSVEFSKGVFDNGAGSVIIMEAARYFMQHPPKRTLQFNWYGSEEIGLEGSWAYVKANREALEKHALMINVDVGGPVLGHDALLVTGGEDLAHFADYFYQIHGLPVAVKQSIYSSDCIPFADCGVPAISFIRSGAPGASFIHNRFDTMDFLSAEALGKTVAAVLAISDALVNAESFPVEKKIPENIKEDVDKYLYKKEMAELDRKEEKK